MEELIRLAKENNQLLKDNNRMLGEIINVINIYLASKEKLSIVAIGKADSKKQFLNTIVHEAKHVQSHICMYYDVPEDGEDAAYLIGYIVMKMFDCFKQIICQ